MELNKSMPYIYIKDIDGNEIDVSLNGDSRRIVEMLANAIVGNPAIPLAEMLLSGVWAACVWQKKDIIKMLEQVKSNIAAVEPWDK